MSDEILSAESVEFIASLLPTDWRENQLLAHDGALRARVAALAEERDTYRQASEDNVHALNDAEAEVAALTEERDEAQTEIERLRTMVQVSLYPQNIGAVEARAEAAEAGLAALRAGLRDAIETVEEWAAYADDYFKQKWDLAGDLARLRALLGGVPAATPEPDDWPSPHNPTRAEVEFWHSVAEETQT